MGDGFGFVVFIKNLICNKDLIVSYLEQWGKGKRSDFIELLGNKLPDVLTEKQKVNKV